MFVTFSRHDGNKLSQVTVLLKWIMLTTLIKKKRKCFIIFKEIQMGSVAKTYMRKGFLIYEEMRQYLVIYGEAVSHVQ